IGKATSLATLGVYQLAHQLAWMPTCLIYALVREVLFPLYSRSRETEQGFKEAVRKMHRRVEGLGAFAVTCLLAGGPALIKCCYGEQYQEASWIVQVLAVGVWLKMLESAGGGILWGMGHSRAPAVNNAIKVAALAALLPLGYSYGGLSGVLAALVAADFIRY